MTNRKSVVTNMLWRFAERCGAQGVSFVVSLVLARLLLPEEYGVVSLITVFTTILNLFIDCGFSNALIQKKDADQLDFSTVFYFNLFVGILLYFLMCLAAPAIAHFYNRSYMVPYIRVMSLTLVLGSINGVQSAVVAKRMQFKRFFYSTLGGTIVSAAVGIGMAYMGMGVWALIAQRLINQTIDTAILWITVRWRPTLEFSIKRLKPMFNYGSKLLISSVLDSCVNNLSGLVIGKVYSADTLAYYDKGGKVPFVVVTNLQAAAQSVLFPVIAEQQNQKERVKAILRLSSMTSAYCVFPCMVGIAACATPLVRILYTEKWISMVPYLQLWCFTYAFYLLHTANLQVIQAVGRSDIFLRIEIIKQAISFIALIIAIPFGVIAIMISMCIITVISLYINAAPNKELADYGFIDQMRELKPIIDLNIVMGIIVYTIGYLGLSDIPLLMLQIITGITVYIVGSYFLHLESFEYILGTAKDLLKK